MKIFYLIVIGLLHCGRGKESKKELWEKFKVDYKKSYSLEEEQHRFEIFKINLKKINDHNDNYEKGLTTYQLGVNKFADLTTEEYSNIYKMYPAKTFMYNETFPKINEIEDGEDSSDSEYLDWREKGAVTPAKNQGTCGACWIFSAVGILESYYYRKYNQLIPFSEQNIIDCISNTSCKGGWPPRVFDFAEKHGLIPEEEYQYEEKQGECRKNKTGIPIHFSKLVQIHNSEEKLKEAVTNFGPVLVCAYAGSSWMFYRSGVWYERECSHLSNHAMVLIGYGKEKGLDYWLVKNSMGRDWGEDGYIKIARNRHHNYCGITATSFYLI